MASAIGPDQRVISPEEERRSPPGVGALLLARARVPRTEEENADGQVYRAGRTRVKLHGSAQAVLAKILTDPVRGILGATASAIPKSANKRPTLTEQDVGWLHIPMDDALLMRGVKGLGYIRRNPDRPLRPEAASHAPVVP